MTAGPSSTRRGCRGRRETRAGCGATFYVLAASYGHVWICEQDAAQPTAHLVLPDAVRLGMASARAACALLADPRQARMFVGPCVFDTRRLVSRQTIEQVDRVVARHSHSLYAVRAADRGSHVLCMLDADRLRTVTCTEFATGPGPPPDVAIDHLRHKLCASNRLAACVSVFDLPQSADGVEPRSRRAPWPPKPQASPKAAEGVQLDTRPAPGSPLAANAALRYTSGSA